MNSGVGASDSRPAYCYHGNLCIAPDANNYGALTVFNIKPKIYFREFWYQAKDL